MYTLVYFMTVRSSSWPGCNWYLTLYLAELYLTTFTVVPGQRKNNPRLVCILKHFTSYFVLFDACCLTYRVGPMPSRMDQDDCYERVLKTLLFICINLTLAVFERDILCKKQYHWQENKPGSIAFVLCMPANLTGIFLCLSLGIAFFFPREFVLLKRAQLYR